MSDQIEIIEKIRNYFKENVTRPLSVEELEEVLGLHHSSEFREMVIALNELELSGELVRTRKNRYGLPEKMNLIRGKIEMHAKGFAFLIPEDEEQPDIYIHHSDLATAMNNDRVLVRIEKQGNNQQRPEGVVIRILERTNQEVVGTYEDNHSFGFVIADDKRIPHDIFVPNSMRNGAVDGHKVIVEITKYPEGRNSAEGRVIKILGHENDPGIDILSIIHKNGIKTEFPEEVLAETALIPEEVSKEDMKGRRDLRDEVVVTIDGADAKDLDDAIAVKRLDNGHFLLGVYIADVSYYLEQGSAMDEEALERGTSVYLVDRVIPMLPHRLSNGICSLNPNVDRLALGCEMEVDSQGKIVSHEIFECVIRSKERMTYKNVNKILVEKDESVREKYASLVPMFEDMEKVAALMRKNRMERGSIDFDFKEAKVLVDEEGKAQDVIIQERSVGERLIEEFMLAANETVAEHIYWLDVPFIQRLHEDPDEGKLQHFFEILSGLGYSAKGTAQDVHPKALQQILKNVKGKPEEMIVSRLMLRSMKQAKYDAQASGHFGLAAEYYTHFTAPIRRYPDLTVHRLIRTYLIHHQMNDQTIQKWKEVLPDIAEHSSNMERAAIEAEREVNDLKKAEFMLDKIGEEFSGVISSVTNFGLFVELENTVEGLVHVSYMTDDYYHFNEENYTLVGEKTRNIYRLGEKVRIRVMDVQLDERSVDFELVEKEVDDE